MKICFLSLSGLSFNVVTPEVQPLGGTESSFCYLARELAKTHDVTLVARNCLKQTIMNVKHDCEVNVGDFDVVISNAPIQMTGDRKPKYIFWNHLAHFDSAIKSLMFKDVLQGIDAVVYVSEWQKNECEKQFGKARNTKVIGNGLTPAFENMFRSSDELREAKQQNIGVYTSTPYRGLRLLPEIMDRLENISLEVYSGLAVYQGDDAGYQGIYDSLKRPDTTLCGNLSQVELATKLRRASYMLYPSVFPETFCIAVLEAMAAGLGVITSNLGALPETLKGYGYMAREELTGVDIFVDRFVAAYSYAVSNHVDRWQQVEYVNKNCLWKHRAQAWNSLLQEVVD